MTPDKYSTSHPRLGYALVINQEYFCDDLKKRGFGRRKGTSLDDQNIRATLTRLGFHILSHSNLTVEELTQVCSETSELDHGDTDCFMMVILSHGEDGIIYGTDESIEINKLVKYFGCESCPSLKGKPKMFLIQACRGSEGDLGVEINVDFTDSANEKSQIIKFPVELDFLFVYSTIPGYYSWRNEQMGSWFIQAVCAVLNTHGHRLEVQKVFTMVNWAIANNFETRTDIPYKQISCFVSMLTKDFFFTKKTSRIECGFDIGEST